MLKRSLGPPVFGPFRPLVFTAFDWKPRLSAMTTLATATLFTGVVLLNCEEHSLARGAHVANGTAEGAVVAEPPASVVTGVRKVLASGEKCLDDGRYREGRSKLRSAVALLRGFQAGQLLAHALILQGEALCHLAQFQLALAAFQEARGIREAALWANPSILHADRMLQRLRATLGMCISDRGDSTTHLCSIELR